MPRIDVESLFFLGIGKIDQNQKIAASQSTIKLLAEARPSIKVLQQ